MKKKKYITPAMETIYLDVEPVMSNASITGGFDEDLPMDSEDQGAGGYRGDWSNIWEGM